MKGIVPFAQLCFALAQKWTEQALKSLRQSGIRDVALVLVELARGKQAAGRNERFMEFIHDGGLANTGVAGNEHQLRRAARHDAIESREQGIDLSLPPVQFLRDEELIRHVLRAERERLDPSACLPLHPASPGV